MALQEFIKRDLLPEHAYTDVIAALPAALKALPQGDDLVLNVYARHLNTKTLLRALYFRLTFAEQSPTLRDGLIEALKVLG
jgi:hypothetical protein